MPLPGGPAAKYGNRYESRWTLSQCLRVLRGETDSLRIEAPSVEKAEFVVRIGSRREYHQAKRSHPSGKWSLASLASDGLLQAISELLDGNRDRFVFVSGSDAPELRDLCAAAKDAESVKEFDRHFLRAQTRGAPFDDLLRHWKCDPETAVERLKRIEVRTIGERDLEDLIDSKVSGLFLANSNHVTDALSAIIEDSIHCRLTYERLVARLADRGYSLRDVFDGSSARTAVWRATEDYLAGARRQLIRGNLVPRNAVEALLSRLSRPEERVDSVLTGKAGAGKTACVVQLVDALRRKGMPVLAFRLDRHFSASTTADLGSSLQLGESPVAVLAAAADSTDLPGVLVVDQLDTASAMSGRQFNAIDLISRLLREAQGIHPRGLIQTVIVCRTFDWNHDDRLRTLIVDSSAQVEVTEFDVAEVTEILDASGFDPASFHTSQLELLRLAQNLYLFLESDLDKSRTPTFSTVKELFDRYWHEKRLSVQKRVGAGTDPWTRVIQILCSEMTSTQQLSVQQERLDEIPLDYMNQMVSEGVLVAYGHAYGFGHESFFDYCFARLFVNRSESVVSLLVGSEQHLFRRSQVRQILTYLRDADRDRYLTEMSSLLVHEHVRPHIKALAFGLLADVADPTPAEWRIWEQWTGPALEAIKDGVRSSNRLSELAWRRLRTSRSWFPFLEESGVIEGWMKSHNDRLIDQSLHYLRFHQHNWPDRVAMLLAPYLDLGGKWDSRIRRTIEWRLHHTSRPLFERFLRLVRKGAFDQGQSPIGTRFARWDLLYDLASHRPGWCSEAISQLLRRRLAIARASREDLRNSEFLGFERRAEERIRECAERAPAEFVRHVLPVVLEISDCSQFPGEPPNRDVVWNLFADPIDPTVELACLVGLSKALAELAKDGFKDLRNVIADLRSRNTYAANFLLLALYAGGSPHYADEAVSLLCVEPWRFECGVAENPNCYAMEAIRKIVSDCTKENRRRIQGQILSYVRPFEKTPDGYRQRGYGQFALLSAIPERLRVAGATARLAELKRKFGEAPRPPAPSKAVFLPSPIEEKATLRMTDDQWLGAVAKYRSYHSAKLLQDEPKGGALELARALEVRAKEKPLRFARLSLRFPRGVHRVYLQSTLAALEDAAIPPALKLQVAKKGFEESPSFYGKAIADVLGNIREPLSDDTVNMLRSLATGAKDPAGEPEHQAVFGATRNPGMAILTAGINSTRGRAAIAIAKLIHADRDYIDRFDSTLETMIRDPSVAVRSCVVGTLRAIATHDSPRGILLLQRMVVSDDRLLGTVHAERLIQDWLHHNLEMLRPLVQRMLRSSDPHVCQAGARFAGIAYLLHETASDLADEALGGGGKHRLGIAEVASANIANPQFRAWCVEKLPSLFCDSDAAVRTEAARCFRNLKTEPLEGYKSLIESYCDSLAFRDDPLPLLDALAESRERLPGVTCVVCEKFLDAPERDGGGIHNRYAMPIRIVAKLVFRTYQQYQNDDEWASRSLNLIDRICLDAIGEAQAELEQFER